MSYRLTFLGAPAYLLQQTELQPIIDQNVKLCEQLSLTGLFLYLNGSSLEINEGAQPEVEQYFAVINSYEWHSRLIVIGREPLKQPFFASYLIAYKLPGAIQLSQVKALLEDTTAHKAFDEPNKLILSLIGNFYKNNVNN